VICNHGHTGGQSLDNSRSDPCRIANRQQFRSLLPAEFSQKIILEFGASNAYTARDTLFRNPCFNSHFLLSFEPLIDKYSHNVAHQPGGISAARHAKLSAHHPRGRIFPFAVSPEDGIREFSIANIDGCASLLKYNRGFDTRNGFPVTACEDVVEKRQVPVISLKTIFGWLPPNSIVDFLKCDIQGYDGPTILAAGKLMQKSVRRVLMEVALAVERYSGQMSCAEVLKQMKALGFRLANSAEVKGYASMPWSVDGPLIWADGINTCETTNLKTTDGDLFLVNEALISSGTNCDHSGGLNRAPAFHTGGKGAMKAG
jgi:hypothetical protein